MATLVFSRYNILVPLRHNRVLAYNSFSGATAIWESTDSDVAEQIRLGQDVDDTKPEVSNLLRGGFAVHQNVDELTILRHQYDANRNDPANMILTIAPTLMCNFGCDYCFQGSDKPVGSMGVEVQDAILSLVTRALSNIKRLHVAWYGGEPLLALKVIYSLSDRLKSLCDSRGRSYDAMIVTNGYKLTADVARSLYAREVQSAQVTLDGASRDHDQRRHRLGGGSSFDRIIQNLRAVVEEVPLRVSIRVNIDDRNKNSVYELLDHLSELGLARRRNLSIYFAPVEAITAGCQSIAGSCLSKADYGQLEVDLTRYAFDAGLTPLPYPPRFRGMCGAVKRMGLVILPNGDLHKCWDTVSMPSQRVGTIFDVDAVRENFQAKRWAQWTPFQNGVCTQCKILPNCAGSCAHKFLNPDETLGEAGSLPCPSWKYNIKERLLFMAERSGNILPSDYDAEVAKTDSSDICPVSVVPAENQFRGHHAAFRIIQVSEILQAAK
jgi:uncharacterized protein